MNIEQKINCNVPFGTISLQEDSVKLISYLLKRKRLTNGRYVEQFEKEFAKKFGVKYAVAVSSGTDANTLALATLYEYGAKRGDEVIIPSLSFVATGNSVLNAGFTPVFVDINRESLTIDVTKIKEKITDKTKAIMPVHLMGKACLMDEIMQIAEKNNLYVIEDAAEAHGGKYKDKLLGTIGDIGCFSLYAAHIITAIEGGMIITNSERNYNVLKSLRNHGLELHGSNWTFERIGFSAKMNELEAAVGLGNINYFDDILEKRRFNLKFLIDRFKEFSPYFITLKEEEYEKIAPHAFSIILREGLNFTKEEFVKFLTAQGIDNRNLFYSMPTQSKGFEFLENKLGSYPEAEYCSDNGTHIGIHQDLTIEQLNYIVDSVRKFLKEL